MSGFSSTYTSHIWCHFYFVSCSIPTSFMFGFLSHFDYRHTGKSPTGFQKLLPLQRRFPIFHDRTSPFCYHPFFFIRTLKTTGNYWKINSYSPLQGNDHEPPRWNLTCYPLGHQYTFELINLKHYMPNMKPL